MNRKKQTLEAVLQRILEETKSELHRFEKHGAIVALDYLYKESKGYDVKEARKNWLRFTASSPFTSNHIKHKGYDRIKKIIKDNNIDVESYIDKELGR